VQRAFLSDKEHRASPAVVVEHGGHTLLQLLDGTQLTVDVVDDDRLTEVLARDDLCRLQGLPLAMVNRHYDALLIATGPPTPPSALQVLIVGILEDGLDVELPSDDPEQPGWQVFALVEPDDES
jgi:hypothetical protein